MRTVKKKNYLDESPLSWGYWGANDDIWLGETEPEGKLYKKISEKSS